MKMKFTVLAVLVVALVLGVAGSAYAGGPTLKASRTAVTYPTNTRLTSVTSTGGVLYRMLAGDTEWHAIHKFRSGKKTWSMKPSSTAAYKLVAGGVDSNIVTVTVKAQLSKPSISARGHRNHGVTVKGWVAPLHKTGTVQLSFWRWEQVTTEIPATATKPAKTVTAWMYVQHGDTVDVNLVRQNKVKSKWAYKWTPDAAGKWKVVVSHQDDAHAYSAASKVAYIAK